MKKLLTIIFTSFCLTAVGQDVDSVYNKILDHFADQYLNDSLFHRECSGLKNSNFKQILVNIDSTLWSIKPYIIGHYFNIDQLNSTTKDIDSTVWEWLIHKQTISDIKIDLQDYNKFEPTQMTVAPLEIIKRACILRFSAPLLWDNFSYIELWIKKDYHSSGTRIIYRIDSSGKIMESIKYNMCDDWG